LYYLILTGMGQPLCPAGRPSASLGHEREWPIPPERAQEDDWGSW
jgi:hypothetical protein